MPIRSWGRQRIGGRSLEVPAGVDLAGVVGQNEECHKSSKRVRGRSKKASEQLTMTTISKRATFVLFLQCCFALLLVGCHNVQRPAPVASTSSIPDGVERPQVSAATSTANGNQTDSEPRRAVARQRRDDRSGSNGRLVDSIAEPLEQQASEPLPDEHLLLERLAGDQLKLDNNNKLNYIIDFLKHHKLGKFCELLQRNEPQIRDLVSRLNAMPKFTLFVPTNEALLLMSGSQLESLESSAELASQFLMAHATGDLVLPRLNEPVAGQSLGLLASKYSPAGAQNRWSSGRPLERLVQQPASTSSAEQTLMYSLAGGPLRIITTPVLVGSGPNSSAITTRLELIVNGANVLSGHSHALQEPNNTAQTYAIVHLIDRPLWPVPTLSVLERLQQVAPRFARLLLASQDQGLLERLRSPLQLTTAFAPTDDAFRSIPSKLLEQLDSNRTSLRHFLRSHLAEGVFYSGQLAAPLDVARNGSGRSASLMSGQLVPRLLNSMADDVELQFETKMIQSRQLISVNSIPIVTQDLSSLNGVLHLIVRPLFDRRQLDAACHCESIKTLPDVQADYRPFSGNSLASHASEQAGQRQETRQGNSSSLSNWFQQNAGASRQRARGNELGTESAPELEREESQSNRQQEVVASPPLGGPAAKVTRNQRSDNLVSRNNRDFYRPSTAPSETQATNFELARDQNFGLIVGGAGSRQNQHAHSANLTTGQRRQQTASELLEPLTSFEVERYKVVMDASMRQKLREQQQQQQQQQPGGLIMSSSRRNEIKPLQAEVFAYDQPLGGQDGLGAQAAAAAAANSSASLWSYSAQPALPVAEHKLESSQTTLSQSASSQRDQRLLKFQAEDARDGAKTVDQFLRASSSVSQQRQTSKTVAPSIGAILNGCAFYDTECKRLIQMSGKLVRLPARSSKSLPPQLNQTAAFSYQQANNNPSYQSTTPSSAFDAGFGETTTTTASPGTRLSSLSSSSLSNNRLAPSEAPFMTPPQRNVLVNFPTRADINSTLPSRLAPWAAEKSAPLNKGPPRPQAPVYSPSGSAPSMTASQNVNWRAQDVGDLSRLRTGRLQVATNSSSAISQQPNQVLLIPVEMFQHSNISLANTRQQLRLQQQQQQPQPNQSRPIYFAPPPPPPRSDPVQPTGGSLVFHSNSQYFSPTSQPQIEPPARLSANLSSADSLEASQAHSIGSSKYLGQPAAAHRIQRFREGPLETSYQTAIGEEQRLINETFQTAIEQARKTFRLQAGSQPPYQQPTRFDWGQAKGDISITSARLSGRPAPSGSGLAVQASNQAPNVSGFAQGSSSNSSPAEQSSQPDFFQNRTIAEVMVDSGLRIDGQQVTFGRLRDCLDQAGLSNLIMQQGSPLTIFMPTDVAFQRLVQQQTAMQQQQQQQRASSSAPSSFAARLLGSVSSGSTSTTTTTDTNTGRHLIPLVARAGSPRNGNAADNAELARLQTGPIEFGSDSSLVSLAQRLTLDCSSPQVRQLLLDHLSNQLVQPRQLQKDLVLESLSGRRLLLSSVPSKKIVVVDGQPVIAATRTKNGMVYVLNKFLNISQQEPNVVDLLESQPNLKTFRSYLSFASLNDRLKREIGPITILAPTNEAFEQLSSAARQLLNSDPAAMMDILRGHIVEGAQFGKLISMRNRLKTMNSDHFIEARVIKPNVYQLDNQMTSMRLVGTSGNGVVNAIDRLIVPPWLRVSANASTGGGGGGLSNRLAGSRAIAPDRTPSNFNELVSLDLSNELGVTSRQSSGALNLPSLNNQPIRFEQPNSARLAPANSFSLASGAASAPNTSSSDGFDVASPTATGPLFESGPEPRRSFPRADGGDSTGLFANDLIPIGPAIGISNASGPFALSNNNSSSKNMRLIEKLAGLMKARKFVKLLLRSKLSEQLKPDMNYVILVPTDQAVERLPKQIIDVLNTDLERLSDLVNFHVLDTTFEYINTIPDGQTLNTLNEKDILFNWHRNNTILTASGSVVLGGIQEENIALLIVDRVLYPTPGDLLSIVTKSPILSNFTSLLKNAGLERQLSLAGPFTLFAPSDYAFNQLERRDLEFLQQNRDSARRFLLRHLSQPAIFTSSIALSNTTETRTTSAIVPLMSVTNSLGEELVLRQKNDYFSVNDVNFSYADVAATNGVVHVIDGLL